MSLRYYFAKAQKTLNIIAPYDRTILEKRCRSIQIAEEQLQAAGRTAFLRCYSGCEGLCCRNLEIDAVIGFSDFIYLLTVERQLQESISTCLKHENRIFASDCIFLLNGKGPCLFPPTSRPEVCITTFCTDVEPVKLEIRCVKSQFMKLNLYLFFLRAKMLINRIYSHLQA
ncbi:MAG: hypothetical protein BWK74_02985 [Desulfobacteraceae bacterium A6]|nr:MAG: hypothetical protein BWK74_02985 [Desulfobacteraceae bacterium A6]